MVDEAAQNICRQVVFLIDSNPSFWGWNCGFEDTSNAIRLCVLKILTYFSDNGRGKRSNLRWGYKFFNSRTLSHQFERHEFKDFSVAVFEEFETEVSKKLNESFTQVSNTLEQHEPDGEKEFSFGKAPAGAKCISCALTNVVHDFQWERPDISSPVRSTRGNNNLLHGNISSNYTRNVMFLLSGCPCNDESISNFTGETSSSLRTFDSVKNILMPSMLFKEFKQRQICLHWVNVENAQQENTGLKSFLVTLVEQLGGCLMPLSAVIYVGNIFSLGADLTNTSGRSVSAGKEVSSYVSHGPLLPFKTVMDFYFCGKPISLSEVVNATQNQAKLGCPESTGFLCSSGTDEKVHCAVKLCSMFQPVPGKQCLRVHHHSTSDRTNDANDQQASSTEVLTSDKEKSPPNLLWIRGVISQACICPMWLHPTKGYSCIGMDDRHADDSPNSSLSSQRYISGWFQELLLSLANDSKLLVLDFVDCDTGLPVSGVLQPMTSVCGVISVIASDFLVKFDKLLLWNGKTAVLDRKSVKSTETSHLLVNRHRSKTVSKPAMPLGYNEVFVRLTRSQNNVEATDSRKFDAGFVDPWCSFPDVDDNNRLLWSELSRVYESEKEKKVDNEERESDLMKELKKLYNSKETKSTSTAFNGRPSPKQSKVKLNTPMKTKAKRAVLKQRNVEKETETKDQNNKLDKKESQPAVSNIIGDSCTNKEKKMTTKSSGTQGVPCNIKDEAELVKVVHDVCDKVILEEANILDNITNIVTLVSISYVQGANREKDCASKFLGEHLLLTISALKEKYEGCSDVIRTGQQVREYQLQILLRMEIAVLANADENSPLVEEVTALLRAISFMKDPKFLTVYLREVLLQRYSHSLAKFLCGVYEGLMMRPPRELLTPSKWSSDDESPIRRSVNSNSSAKQDSNQPRSSGCRVLTRHLSVTDAVGKRREIVVPGKAKPKEKEKKKKEKPQSSISSRGASKKEEKKATGQKTPVKLVRRNLFTESEGADENNSTASLPRKRKLSESGGKHDQTKRRFHRRNTVGSFSKSAVQETPAHKQVSNALWNKQDRARKRSRAYTEVHVLQESPLKELQAGEMLPRRSPRRPPSLLSQRSQSFYGRSASAGILTRTRSFTESCSRDSPKKEPTAGRDPGSSKKTPQKMSFAAVVSPLRFSPRQKKKFSLHSLLTTAKECDPKEKRLTSLPKPTTPNEKRLATRSSPRILKKRSFSCIGFSSVPFPVVQEKKSDPHPVKPRSFDSANCNSPLKEDVCSDIVARGSLMKTPKKRKSDNLSEVGKITPKSTSAQKMPFAAVSPLRFSPRSKENCWPSPHKRAIPKETLMATRSSPRLFTKRSLSAAGFSSFSGVQEKNSGPTCRNSPLKEDVCSDDVVQENLMKTPKKQKADNLSEVGKITPKSTSDKSEKRTPLKDHHLDECVVLLTPIRRPLSVLHVSPKVVIDESSSCSQGHTYPGVAESSKQGVDSAIAPVPVRTPVKNDVNPAVRSSPRLAGHRSSRDISESSKGTFNESLCNFTDSRSKDRKIANPSSEDSPRFTEETVVNPRTPVKGRPFDDCVVLLSPIRGPLTSPVHVLSQEKVVLVVHSGSESTGQLDENPDTNKLTDHGGNSLLSKEVATSITSSTAMTSVLDASRERRLRKKSPIINGEATGVTFKAEGKFSRVSQLENDKCCGISAATEEARQTAPYAHFQGDAMSPRLTRASPKAAQLLLNQRPENSTTPQKKGKKKSNGVSFSPVEPTRLSPLNQILRQQKRKRCFSSSPADKRSIETIEVCARDPLRIPSKKMNVSSSVFVEDDNSMSSEDVVDWLCEMEKEFDRSLVEEDKGAKSPATKKRRIDKSVVFGRKRAGKESSRKQKKKSANSSLSSDTSFEEDDEVFQSPAALASACLKRRHLNKTPLTASSIKLLQESPILCDSKLSMSPSARTRSCYEVSPNSEEYSHSRRLARRVHGGASISEDFVDDQEEPIGFNLRKRLKLNT